MRVTRRPAFLRYGFAILLAALAQAARLPLHPPARTPFITFVPFLLLAAAFGGLGPGLVATVLCTLEAIYYAIQPSGSFRTADPQHWLRIGELILTGVVASILFDRLQRAEAAQRAAYLELATTHRHAPVMLVVVDEALRVRKANDLAVQFAGRNVQDILGHGPGAAIGCLHALADPQACGRGPSCAECVLRLTLSDTLRNGISHSGVEAWVTMSVDGCDERRCLLFSTVAMQLEKNSRAALICAQDITEKKRTEVELREQHDALLRQAELIEMSHDAIIKADESRVITGWNRGAAEVYGWTEAEAVGHVIHRLLGTSATIAAAEIDETLSRAGRWDGELEHTRRDGTRITVDSRQVILRDPGGHAAGILEINRDITERKRAEEEVRRLNAELEQRVRDRTTQLEAANQELETFSYSVSHDLRAPLRGIDGWSLALVEDFGSELSGKARQYLERVRSEAQRMDQLIDDLLRLSRVNRGTLERGAVDLTALAQGVARSLQEAHNGRRLEFVIEPGLAARGDARLLEVVFSNLLGNAAKFTGKRADARIEVGRIEHEGQPAFYVRDNGAGFDMTYADSLFGAFQRLHSASEFPGTGVGLATVQRIIHRHGGRVWAEAQVGKGATFYFTLE